MLLDRLKNETRESHERLERDLDLLGPGYTCDRYTRLLGRFYGYYDPWERLACNSDFPLLRDVLAERGKSNRLASDLRALGLSDDRIGALPRCDYLPPADSEAKILGTLYVMEGATLGGQIISRHVCAAFALRDGRGCSFFSSYGDQVGRMWQSFRQVLSGYSRTDRDDIIVDSASETFRTMHTWLVARD